MTAHRDRDDSAQQVEANDPIESAEQAEPIDAIERNEPTLPIDRIDPFEPIESSESSDHKDQRDVRMRFNISAVWPTGDKSGTTPVLAKQSPGRRSHVGRRGATGDRVRSRRVRRDNQCGRCRRTETARRG